MTSSFLIAGTHSGCGKTTISLGIMAALGQMGHQVQPFKCGPDFIDPTLHAVVCGQTSRNLDLRMCGPEFVRHTFTGHPAVVRVVEGVMGLFDGGEASAACLAKELKISVVLVVDASAVNVGTVGTYPVTFDVTDTAGETRSDTSTVSVGYTALQATVTTDAWQTPDINKYVDVP